jgi:hypothetical protein
MNTAYPTPAAPGVSLWRDCIAPKEHGSWSLAFEPIVLSLLLAFSLPGALFAVVLAAIFFARRPMRIVRVEQRADRRLAAWEALGGCAMIAIAAGSAAAAIGGTAWLVWLVPMALCGGVFAWLDVRGAGREEAAEIAGAAAFALAPAVFAALAGWTRIESAALAILVVGRAVPSVMGVRAFLRAAKTGVRRDAPALVASLVAVAGAAILVEMKVAPFAALLAMIGFAMRAFVLLVVVRPAWRARTVGIVEAVLGIGFVAAMAIVWR